MLIRARIVLPVSSPALENGALLCRDGIIQAVGPFDDLKADHPFEPVTDVGESVLLPGLINAHCHLDYTRMAGAIPPTASFTRWVQSIIAMKAGWSYTDFAESWVAGMNMLSKFGTTTVADIEAVPELLPDILPHCQVRVFSFRELITVRSQKTIPQLVDSTVAEMDSMNWGIHSPGLSPHAPYSTKAELVPRVMDACKQRNWRWTMHLAESHDEWEMFELGRGPMLEWLSGQRDCSDCGKNSPVQWLAKAGGMRQDLIAVHVNHLGPGDAEILGQHGVHVVHCPVSHAYFQHRKFDYTTLARAGVNICLGTDSLASHRVPSTHKPTLNLFAEMQAFLRVNPEADPGMVLRWATVHGAKALGLEGRIGQLSVGASADWIAIPFAGGARSVEDAVVHHRHPVSACMIRGEWVTVPESQ